MPTPLSIIPLSGVVRKRDDSARSLGPPGGNPGRAAEVCASVVREGAPEVTIKSREPRRPRDGDQFASSTRNEKSVFVKAPHVRRAQ